MAPDTPKDPLDHQSPAKPYTDPLDIPMIQGRGLDPLDRRVDFQGHQMGYSTALSMAQSILMSSLAQRRIF